jgi:hypothetical protein
MRESLTRKRWRRKDGELRLIRGWKGCIELLGRVGGYWRISGLGVGLGLGRKEG